MHPPSNDSRIRVRMRWEGHTFVTQVSTSATIYQLMDSISQTEGIGVPVHRLNLYRENANPSQLSEAHHNMTVQQCGLTKDCIVDVLWMLQITVQYSDGQAAMYLVNEDSTVGNLKANLGAAGGQNMALEMIYNGQHLLVDDRAYLWAAGIKEGETLRLVPFNPVIPM